MPHKSTKTAVLAAMAFLAFLTAAPAVSAGVKYVAVVETEVDAASGASADITSAEVRLMTAELRREAVKNLPRAKYNVMTSETVQSMGGAVLEECSEENCVITLGSRIGADYIVRGTVSKFQTKFTLSVEMYETENGTLVASSDPVRSEKPAELLEMAAAVCAEMFKAFADAQTSAARTPPPPPEPPLPPPPQQWAPPPQPSPQRQPKPKPEPGAAPAKTAAKKFGAGGGALYSGGFGGGIQWDGGREALSMPYHALGAYLFLDFAYAAISIAYQTGGGEWSTPNNVDPTRVYMPYMQRSSLNIGAFAKYPNIVKSNLRLGDWKYQANIYPVYGFDYESAASGKLEFADKPPGYAYVFDGSNEDGYAADALNALWVKIGGGVDVYFAENTPFFRVELMYGVRTANVYETDKASMTPYGSARLGHGVTFRAGAGLRL